MKKTNMRNWAEVMIYMTTIVAGIYLILVRLQQLIVYSVLDGKITSYYDLLLLLGLILAAGGVVNIILFLKR